MKQATASMDDGNTYINYQVDHNTYWALPMSTKLYWQTNLEVYMLWQYTKVISGVNLIIKVHSFCLLLFWMKEDVLKFANFYTLMSWVCY